MRKQRQHSASNALPSKTALKALQAKVRQEGKGIKRRGLSLLLQSLLDSANRPGSPALEPLRRIFSGLTDERVKGIWQTIMEAIRTGPIDRLARCPICEKFFLRSRKDQKGCTTACADNIRVRRWRDNYQDSYKPQRIKRAENLAKEGE